MSMNLKKTLFKTVAILTMLAPSAGALMSNPVMADSSSHTTTHLNKQQKSSKIKQENATKSKNYKKYSNQLKKDESKLDADETKSKQTGTAGSTIAKKAIPQDKAKVKNDKTMLPKNMQKKPEAQARQSANKQAQQNKVQQNKAKKAQAKKNQLKNKKANAKKEKRTTGKKLVNKPVDPTAKAHQTAHQKAAQKDAQGEASNATGQHKLPKDRKPNLSNPKQGTTQNKKSLPKTLEQKPATWISLGAGLTMIIVGGTVYLKHRKNA